MTKNSAGENCGHGVDHMTMTAGLGQAAER